MRRIPLVEDARFALGHDIRICPVVLGFWQMDTICKI
jgi:hypothetical protein